MRDIEFRGKSKGTKEWVFGWLVKNIAGDYSIVTGQNKEDFHKCIPVIEVTIGQYAGSKDKNDVKIFEDDKTEPDDDGMYEVCTFKDGSLGWCTYEIGDDVAIEFDVLTSLLLDRVEISGNIHEQ